MFWQYLSKIADILGIIGFAISLLSLNVVRKVYSNITVKKESYNQERLELIKHLSALQENIWSDNLTSIKIQDSLQTKVFEYQIKYFFISSPRCIFHAFRCTYLLRKGINDVNTKKIRQDVNYLIARLSKKE
jgi:hypothetical protein|nr:MAG TPA_asm: hypothetical protein [Caudoviricetes sp.]